MKYIARLTILASACLLGSYTEQFPRKTTALHQFDHTVPTDGTSPFAGLVQATNGFFYGQPRTAGRTAMARCSRLPWRAR